MRCLAIVALFLLVPAAASAQRVSYLGAHPVDLAGHWDMEEGVHEHDTLLVGSDPFGEIDGVRVFLADPIAYGWTEAVWTYRGAHPIPGLDAYCGVTGDHRHAFVPEGSFRRTSTGVHVFIGGMRGGVPMARPTRVTPREPVVVPPRIATPAPYWFFGCQFQLLPGALGSSVPTPLVAGCVPNGGRTSYGTSMGRGAGGGRAAAAPSERSWFDGRYGGFGNRPVRQPPPAPPSTQRD
ncbi:MAG: hypothetical protein KC619_30040 [Myxococcales bacterium]|nr:hypothetical protein [Myxococcales bacterium]